MNIPRGLYFIHCFIYTSMYIIINGLKKIEGLKILYNTIFTLQYSSIVFKIKI